MPDEIKVKKSKAEVQGDNTLESLATAATSPVVQEQKAQEPVKEDVSFYLLKTRKIRILLASGKVPVEIKGENSIINIPVSDPHYDFKVDYLRASRKNRKNGGTEFVELNADEKKPGGECLLDSLLDLSVESLRGVLVNKDPKHRALTRGSLIMLILGEKGAL
jgi:hypothetical protein